VIAALVVIYALLVVLVAWLLLVLPPPRTPRRDPFEGARRRTRALEVMAAWTPNTYDPREDRRQALLEADAEYLREHNEEVEE
jgi:hypothetical protein